MLLFYLFAPVLLCWQSIAYGLHEEPDHQEYEASCEEYDDDYYHLTDEGEFIDQLKEAYQLLSTMNLEASLEEMDDENDNDHHDHGLQNHHKTLDMAQDGIDSLLPEIKHHFNGEELERNARSSVYEYYLPYYPPYPYYHPDPYPYYHPDPYPYYHPDPYPYYYPDPWTGMPPYYSEYIPLAVPAQDVIPMVEETLVPVQGIIPAKGRVTIARTYNFDDCSCHFPPLAPMTTPETPDHLIPVTSFLEHCDDPGYGQEISGVIPVSGRVSIAAKYDADDCRATFTPLPSVPATGTNPCITNDPNIAVMPTKEVCGQVAAHGHVTIAAQYNK